MQRLRCDKPYNLDEARKRRGLPRVSRKDSRTTLYELTLRVPDEYTHLFENKRKFTKRVYVLNRKELQAEIEAFEAEKCEELDNAELEHNKALMVAEKKSLSLPKNEKGLCTACLTSYAERYIELRSNGSVKKETLKHEEYCLKYINATIGSIPVYKVTADDVESCLIAIPTLSRQWAEAKRKEREDNRKKAKWAKKKALVKPFKEIKVAGSDTQAKVLKFLRELYNYALDKEDVTRNPARARFLSRVFRPNKPLIDPLMADEAARFLEAIEALPPGYFKLGLLVLLNCGLRPEEMLALRAGSFEFGETESSVRVVGALDSRTNKISEYPKTDAGRRTIPIDDEVADVAKHWIALKSQIVETLGVKPTLRMPLMSPNVVPYTYNTWRKAFRSFADSNGFEGVRAYALRHTYATLNLANGENIKTISVLMGHASPSYTLDLYAGYVPNTAIGIGTRFMNMLKQTIHDS